MIDRQFEPEGEPGRHGRAARPADTERARKILRLLPGDRGSGALHIPAYQGQLGPR